MSNTDKTYRVVQWAAGRIGQSAMRATIRHPNLELVGLHVHSESKEGRDAGELCGLDPVGIKATRDIQAVLDLKPDCVFYMQEGFDLDDMCQLLEAGINIVTTRTEFYYPKSMNPDHRDRLEAACRKGGTSLFATGSSPGFSTAVLPVAMTFMSRRLDCLTIDEFADIPASTSPSMITDVMGFGQPEPEEFNPYILEHIAGGFAQSLEAFADAVGLAIDKFETVGEFAQTNSPVTIPDGTVLETGTVAGQRITVCGMRGGKPVLRFRANWYCTKDLNRDWELNDNGWRVMVEGDTPMRVDIGFPLAPDQSFEHHMSGLTAHPAVNTVSYVCEAAPGIRSNLDLPVILPQFG